MQSDTRQAESLYTVRQFCDRHEWARPGGIRHAIFHRDSNGLAQSGAIVRFGRKLLLDEARFVDWMRLCEPHRDSNCRTGGR